MVRRRRYRYRLTEGCGLMASPPSLARGGTPPLPSTPTLGMSASNAGSNSNVVVTVENRLISSNTPMLAVPGCRDSASEPNAVAVVRAENRTARAVAVPRKLLMPLRQFMTK